MGNQVTPTCERPLIKEVNWHIIEPFYVYDSCLCITSAWGVPFGLCEVFLLEDLQDGGSDLGRCCNYGMAVWERKGEDKAVWREAAGKRTEF
jgi:hypothetical protein